jgi:hypothetical protein
MTYSRRLPTTDPRLQRHVVHDPASKDFPVGLGTDTSTWRSRSLRIIDPRPNPNQEYGNCTTCSKCSQLNAVGNRVPGSVLNMDDALVMYEYETTIDPFGGYFKRGDPNSQDTGSNGLASCKTAQHFGIGGAYRWFFGGIDEIVTYLMTPDAIPVSVGTAWYQGMFNRDSRNRIEVTGPLAGGHQWDIYGYGAARDEVLGVCWWGDWRRFRIDRNQLGDLLADDGDAHIQERSSS